MSETTLDKITRLHVAAGRLKDTLTNHQHYVMALLEEVNEVLDELTNVNNYWRAEHDTDHRPPPE